MRVIEFEAVGPSPYACMMLADNGAEVIRIARPVSPNGDILVPSKDVLARSRRVIRLDLKCDEGIETARKLARSAEIGVERFHPSVMEKLGLGPAVLLRGKPSLVYARMTGWGHARATGEGQVIDCAMVEGAASLTAMLWAMRAADAWRDERGCKILDTGSHFYDSYETADGKYVAIGPVEPQFYAQLLEVVAWLASPASNASSIRGPGRHSKTGLRAFLKPGHAMRGVPVSRMPTPALFRCCRWPRRRCIRKCRTWHIHRSGRRRPAGAGAAKFANGQRRAVYDPR